MHSLPIFLRLAGRPVAVVGEGAAAEAKRRLLERAGARIVGEEEAAAFGFVALEGVASAEAAARLKARGMLVNVADRPELCDFTLPAIVDRDPVLVAIGTGGVSAGLAAALRQRLEGLLPQRLGELAASMAEMRAALRSRFPDAGERRRAIALLLGEGGALDPLAPSTMPLSPDAAFAPPDAVEQVVVTSPDPDELTLRAARLLGRADRICHPADMAAAVLDRARADVERIVGRAPALPLPGLTVELAWR